MRGKYIRVRIDLSKDFPVRVMNRKLSLEVRKCSLKDLCIPEDLPGLITLIDEAASGNVEMIKTHFRINGGNNNYWMLLLADFNRVRDILETPCFSGVIVDISRYINGIEIGEDPAVVGYRRRLAASNNALTKDSSLTEILEIGFLTDIQLPFKNMHGVFSAIFDKNDNVICTPNGTQEFNLKKYEFFKKVHIRVSRNVAAYWVIASNRDEILADCSYLLEVLASTVSRMANAYIVLFHEMSNSESANRMLSENIEHQILINCVYNIALAKQNVGDSLKASLKLIGENMDIDRVAIYSDNSANREILLNMMWDSEEEDSFLEEEEESPKKYSYEDVSNLLRELDETDAAFSVGENHDLHKFGFKGYFAANLLIDGMRYGFILYLSKNRDKVFSAHEIKSFRALTQIVSTMLIRLQMNQQIENNKEQLEKMAFHDALLGIPNRAKLDEDFTAELSRTAHGAFGAAVMVKIINMRAINTMFGHTYSDRLLWCVADYIKSMPFDRDDFCVYRFSGNTMCVLLKEGTGKLASNFAQVLIARFEEPWRCFNNSHYLEVNLGIALYPESGKAREDVYRSASLALYNANACGTNSYAFYIKDFEKPIKENYELSWKLRQAINNDMEGFFLKEQPVFFLESGGAVLHEMYVCWEASDRLAVIPAASLVQIMETTGLDTRIDEWVIRKACRYCKSKLATDPDFTVNVNITSREIESGVIIQVVKSALEETGLPPDKLAVDIPAAAFVRSGNAVRYAKMLEKIGVKLVVDSYGQKFTSPEIFRDVKIDYVKSDAALFAEGASEFDKITFEAALGIAKALSGGICAKRVESAECAERLKAYGVVGAQGVYFGEPKRA